jgi:hypothetical protein
MLRTFIFLNPNQQMAVGTYERTNGVKLHWRLLAMQKERQKQAEVLVVC